LDTLVKPAYDGALINVLQRHNPRDRLDRARDRRMRLRDQPSGVCKYLLQVFVLGVSAGWETCKSFDFRTLRAKTRQMQKTSLTVAMFSM
jgi:hypothetical protein